MSDSTSPAVASVPQRQPSPTKPVAGAGCHYPATGCSRPIGQTGECASTNSPRPDPVCCRDR